LFARPRQLLGAADEPPGGDLAEHDAKNARRFKEGRARI